MKKFGGMYYPKHRKHKEQKYRCSKCGKELTPSTAFYYVDGNCCTITNNAKPHCKECYIATYGRY